MNEEAIEEVDLEKVAASKILDAILMVGICFLIS